MGGSLEPAPELTDPVDSVGVAGVTSRDPGAGRRRWGLVALLGPPVAWMLIVYIAALVLLIVTAFFRLDPVSSSPTSELTLDNVRTATTTSQYVGVVARSIAVAATVTALCVLIALPMAYYIAKIARPRYRRALVVAALLPLWAGYLVKGYAWKAMLRPASEFGVDKRGGFLEATFGWTPGFGWVAVILALTHLWLPYMILPIYAGLERLPPSLLDASGDLGATPFRTMRSVVLPMLLPAIAAGSVFTFSLTMGDFIIPRIVTEGRVRLIGNLIESTLLAPNQPLAAAFTLWPLVVIIAYLLGMKRLGAFENL